MPATRHRFTVADYYRMAEAGILHEDDRVELIEGEILDMEPISPRHASCVTRLTALFLRGLDEKAIVPAQNPLRLNQYSEPQPDLSLLRWRADFYATAHSTPEDALLVAEVADTSLGYDRDIKAPLYARSGIPEVWLVDLTHKSISIYRGPGPDAYGNSFEVRGTAPLSPQAFPDFALTPDQVFGRPT